MCFHYDNDVSVNFCNLIDAFKRNNYVGLQVTIFYSQKVISVLTVSSFIVEQIKKGYKVCVPMRIEIVTMIEYNSAHMF